MMSGCRERELLAPSTLLQDHNAVARRDSSTQNMTLKPK